MDSSPMRSMGGCTETPLAQGYPSEAFLGGVRGMLMVPGSQVPPSRPRDLIPICCLGMWRQHRP